MHITLAPMEGVMDYHMRQFLTEIGGIDRCVTEFVRVVELPLPSRVFYRLCPELHNLSQTQSGTPVRIQLLGQDPECLTENSVRAIKLGSDGIDLNFGCPAKTVNKSRGGAVLLKDPDALYQIVKSVRDAVDGQHVVSAKIRLGYEDKSLAIENAQAIAEAGASELAVHARTKEEGYKPPAHWHWIKKIKQSITIPVIANGDIFSFEDAQRCIEISGCDRLMIGRGSLAVPNLANAIKGIEAPYTWLQNLQVMEQYFQALRVLDDKEKFMPSRIKQWLMFMKLQHPQADPFLQSVRAIRQSDDMLTALQQAQTKLTNS
ncbi:tRNA dihydrouridine(16) synthase DusC [Psychromonas sp. RZ22]|uniref:tRNA-dihydrouridine synthase n=1 Tax=Psychromonas algarum TaxID=2555643 RepID=UPI0010685759|nr:tRNA-dihydrouridine synthase [Psychromonas sp. RZ22]TEW56184.1 tRNA dihydrouridine(16) synthase DusC [Psychromonas sp. RZ22]